MGSDAGMCEADRVFTMILAQKKSVIPTFCIGHREQGDGANVRGHDWFADGTNRERLTRQLLATTAVPGVEAD